MAEERYTQPWLEKLETEIVGELRRNDIRVLPSKYITNLFPTDAWRAHQERMAKRFSVFKTGWVGGELRNPEALRQPYDKLAFTYHRDEGVAFQAYREGIGAIGLSPATSEKQTSELCKPDGRNLTSTVLDRLFTGLHEAGHLQEGADRGVPPGKTTTIFDSDKPAGQLTEEAFRKKNVTVVPRSKGHAYQSEAHAYMHRNMSEGLADAAAVNFMLHRYGDDPRIPAYIEQLIATRTASLANQEEGFSGTTHATQSVVKHALNAWRAAGQPHRPDYSLTRAVADGHAMIKENLDDILDNVARAQPDLELMRPFLKDFSVSAASVTEENAKELQRARNAICAPEP
jgi:hypothetical protein